MANEQRQESSRARLALAALWSIPGIGPKALDVIRTHVGAELSPLLDAPVVQWLSALPLAAPARRHLAAVDQLAPVGERLFEQAHRGQMSIAFAGDAAYPEALRDVEDAPPLLFYKGSPGAPRRRVGMVGSRHPDAGALPFARKFACQVAEAGLGIVSGAAMGVDRACHWGALDAGGETWAFLGSALDELDAAQAKLLPHFLDRGGTFFSELPPGVRASTTTFPRRNRLISGASDAVLVLRAGEGSGALHTALAAIQQGRPLLALPGDAENPAAHGCNVLIRSGQARLCLTAEDACLAAGVKPNFPAIRPGAAAELSDRAQLAYRALARRPQGFDEVLGVCSLSSSALTSALCELELSGLVVQHPGKMYEKI